jgi:ATP-dependent DNA helicase RecG
MGKETNNAATPEQAPVPKSVLAAAPVAAMTSTGAHASAETTGLESPVSAVAGVGSARARLLAKRGIVTVGDLLLDAPRRHEDRRQFSKIRDLQEGQKTTVSGKVIAMGNKTFARTGRSVFEVILDDGSAHLHCRWWNLPQMERFFDVGDELVVHGKVRSLRPKAMDHPETETLSSVTREADPETVVTGAAGASGTADLAEEPSLHVGRWVPLYSLTDGLTQRARRWIAWNALKAFGERIPEADPDLLAEASRSGWTASADGQQEIPLLAQEWPSRAQAIRDLHFPENDTDAERARQRLALDEFIALQFEIQRRRLNLESKATALPCQGDNSLMRPFLARLGFRPTQAQNRVLREIREDMGGTVPMRRLLQGDVGSGKTLVAAAAALMALESGYSAVVMAPTEILAQQLHANFRRWLEPLQIPVHLWTASVKSRSEPGLNLGLSDVGLTVGTHALIESGFLPERLGLVIIDEQHRFGVAQRERLLRKGRYPHLLVMTATPIPRTLGLTLYGDLDISVLDEKPPGRGKIRTHLRTPDALPKVWAFLRREIEHGHQAYIVYPRILDNGEEDAKSVETEYPRICKALEPQVVGKLHGRMPPEEKERVLSEFRAGRIQALVATSVIEVGIDVPQATLMLIENAQQFGLAQLHQLRGRIGRGAAESHCILMSGKASASSTASAGPSALLPPDPRLKAFSETDDGFELAELDFKLRGVGELTGLAQSGSDHLRFGSLIEDRPLVEFARQLVRRHLRRPPTGHSGTDHGNRGR